MAEPSFKLEPKWEFGKKRLAVVIGVIAAVAVSATGAIVLRVPSEISVQVQLENASIFFGEVIIELRHAGGDDVKLSDLRLAVSENSNSVGISEDGFTVSSESGEFEFNSVLSARRQAPFEKGSVVTIELIHQPTGATLYTLSGVVLTEKINPSIVKIENYRLLVNGEPFVIKGVCDTAIPPGYGSNYNCWGDPNTYQTDFPMIREMGANTVRTFSAKNATSEALNAAYRKNLYIIMGYWVNTYRDYSNEQVRENEIAIFLEMVQKWKNHPAVLMWAFGNELNQFYPINGPEDADVGDWYTLLQDAAQAAHEVDPNHPIIAVEAEIGTIGNTNLNSDDDSLPDLDAWGVNSYRGFSFGGLFSDYRSKSNKPLILTEWGCDALDIRTMAEDQSAQASYVGNLWDEIESNLGTVGGRCLGGTVFSWSDGWFKAGNSSVHDKIGSWANSGYYDYVSGQKNMNEEWWGITSASLGTYEKTPREAYHVLKDLWTENVVIGFTLMPSPNSGSALPNGSIDMALYVLPSGGYSEPISLSTSDLHEGITVDFDPDDGTPPFTSTARISVGQVVEYGTYSLTIVGTGADGKTGTCNYDLKVGMFLDQVVYSDSVLPPSGAYIWIWSGADWGGPAGTFENNYSGESPPEGTKCFKTTSGANWDGNAHVNYAGWGIFYVYPSDHTIDLSDYNYLKFWVKSPKNLKIEIQVGGRIGGKYTTYLNQHGWDGTDAWQEITIPRGTFERADFTRIFGPFLATVAEPSTAFYIDNIRWTI